MPSVTSIRDSAIPDWGFLWAWLLGFGAVVYLGLSGGGFDPLVSNQVGIAIWWVLLLGVLVGALPVRRLGIAPLTALGLLAGLAVWTALSLLWTESSEKTAADVALVTTLLGAFALALLSRGRDGARQMVAAVAAGIFVVTIVALLARLHPAWFPAAQETGRFLTTGRERLSYPLDYWNGLAALIGIGLPLMLHLACSARLAAVKALAAAALPAMFLALFLTLSRGGIGGAMLALAVYFAIAPDRLPRLGTLLLCGAGGAVLILLANQREALSDGLDNAAAHAQGDEMLWIAIAVCAAVGLIRFAATRSTAERPAWSRLDRGQALTASIAAAATLALVLLLLGAPGRVADAWSDFKQPSGASSSGTSRLASASGENRYQLWASATREFREEPLTGTGAGTFQLWWTRDADVSASILDAHSLYLQTLGELGIVGLVLLLAFVGTALWTGLARVLARGPDGSHLAAALAGSTVLWTTSVFDWTWRLPIIPIATFLLLGALLASGCPSLRGSLSWPWRAGVAIASVACLIAIAIPLATTSLLRQSQADARAGELPAALENARSAGNTMPSAAGPRIQEALVLESAGRHEEAGRALRAAIDRESTNWRIWLLLSRLEAHRGNPGAAIAAYRRARSLNPLSPVFASF